MRVEPLGRAGSPRRFATGGETSRGRRLVGATDWDDERTAACSATASTDSSSSAGSSPSPAQRICEAAGADLLVRADRDAADLLPAEPLDLERVHQDRQRGVVGRRARGGRSPSVQIASRFLASGALISLPSMPDAAEEDFDGEVRVRHVRWAALRTAASRCWRSRRADGDGDVTVAGPVAHLAEGDRARVVGRWTEHDRYGLQVQAEAAYEASTPTTTTGALKYLTTISRIGQATRRAARRPPRSRRCSSGSTPTRDAALPPLPRMSAAAAGGGRRLVARAAVGARAVPAAGAARSRRLAGAAAGAARPGRGRRRAPRSLPADRGGRRRLRDGGCDRARRGRGGRLARTRAGGTDSRPAGGRGARPHLPARRWLGPRGATRRASYRTGRSTPLRATGWWSSTRVACRGARFRGGAEPGRAPRAPWRRRVLLDLPDPRCARGRPHRGAARRGGCRFKRRLSVVTGGPGTGKTTLVRRSPDSRGRVEHRPRTCAPTGRAARRLEEATGHAATTIHRLLEWIPREGPLRDAELPGRVRPARRRRVEHAQPRRGGDAVRRGVGGDAVVLVGDADQLPPIGAGKPFADLIESGAARSRG